MRAANHGCKNSAVCRGLRNAGIDLDGDALAGSTTPGAVPSGILPICSTPRTVGAALPSRLGGLIPAVPSGNPLSGVLRSQSTQDSKYLNEYYDFATSKTHGRFILGFDGPRPTGSGSIGGDNFSTGGIAPVVEFTIPLYDTVVENACASSSASRHQHVMAIVRMAIQDIGSDIATMKSGHADNCA